MPSPGCSGILGRAFIDCFAAVELRFPQRQQQPQASESGVGLQAETSGPEIRFHSEYDIEAATAATPAADAGSRSVSVITPDGAVTPSPSAAPDPSYGPGMQPPETGGLTRVDLQTLGATGLWGLQLRVTGGGHSVVLPALLDTGAPVTVLNEAAAVALGLQPAAAVAAAAPPPAQARQGWLGGLLGGFGAPPPPPSGAVQGLRPAPAALDLAVQVAVRSLGSQQALGPAAGNPLLAPAQEEEEEGAGPGCLPLGSVRPLLGDLPGFRSLGVQPGMPAAILGLDVLSLRSTIVLVPREGVVLL